MAPIKQVYVPALRLKRGEQAGLRDLAPDVAARVLPRMIVPPRAERDRSPELDLGGTTTVPDVGGLLSGCWSGREVLVEATHLLPDFSPDQIGRALPKLFEKIRHAGVHAIPVVRLADLTCQTRSAYKAAAGGESGDRLAIVVAGDDSGDHETLAAMIRHLEAMGLSPTNCSVLADFAGSDFSQPGIVAPIIGGALQMLQEFGQWRHMIFQGTNYPEINPASADSRHAVPRNEWLEWCQATSFDSLTADHMMFGDYGADCAKMEFGGSGGRAIRHYRYTTPEAWIVQRGAATGSDEEIMQAVCRNIVQSPSFAGRSFSSADDYIFLTAHGDAGPGNATIWRATNVTHHITRVVNDIGQVRGFVLQQRAITPLLTQDDLFARI